MLTFDTDSPTTCGIVKKDKEGRVIRFYEKSNKNHGNCANGALYAFDNEFISFLKSMPYTLRDFSVDLIPLLIGKIYTWHTTKIYMDIGNEYALKKANLLTSVEKDDWNEWTEC